MSIDVFWMDMVLVPHVGPLVAAVERVGTFSYTIMQKREILGTPGLQHDCYRPKERKNLADPQAEQDMSSTHTSSQTVQTCGGPYNSLFQVR